MTEVNFTVARTLIERPDRYGPLFAVDKRNNDILWELWVTGFEKAVKLRPAAWQRLLIADRETALAMSGLLTLADVDRRDARFSTEQLEALSAAAPDKIGPWVVALNRWRLANHSPASNLKHAAIALQRPSNQCRTQRSMSLRLRQKIQEMLRPQLTCSHQISLTHILRLSKDYA